MADPIASACAELYAFAAKGTDLYALALPANVTTPQENLRNDIEGSLAQGAVEGVTARRGIAIDYVSVENIRAETDPIIAQWCKAASITPREGDPDFNWREVFDYNVGASQSFNRIEWVLGAAAAGGSNVGNPTVARLATDEDSMPMEGWFADVYTLEAMSDYLTGSTEHKATWRLRGTDANPDGWPIEGAPFEDNGIQQHSDLTTVGLSNPSFDLGTFSEPTITALTGWTTGSGAFAFLEIESTAALVYLDTTSSGSTAYSLRFTADGHIWQELQETGGFSLESDDAPYRFGVWCYRAASATGTLTVRLTDVSNPIANGLARAYTIGSLNNAAWNWLTLVSADQNQWAKNFRAEQLCLSFQVATLAVGTVYLDTVIVSPWTRVGSGGQAASGRGTMGTYLHILAGQTQTLKGDLFTLTDTKGQTTVNQLRSGWEGARYGYQPSAASAAETIPDK